MRLLIFYVVCTVLGFFSAYKADTLIGPYPLTDSRHSLAFYGWEMASGLLLLIAFTGFIIYLFDHSMEK